VEPWDGDVAFPDERPAIVLPAGAVGFVSNSYSDSLTILDPAAGPAPNSLKSLATVGVGRDPVAVDGPHHLAVDRRNGNGGYVYIALSYPSDTLTLGPHAGHGASTRLGWLQVLALPTLAPVFAGYMDENPGDIVLSADRTRIAVSHFNLTKALDPKAAAADRIGRLYVYDTSTIQGGGPGGDPKKIPVCRAPHGVTLDSGGRTAWVACYGEDALAVVDIDAGTVKATLPFVAAPTDTPTVGPYALVSSTAGTALAVGTTESAELRVVEKGSLKERFPAVKLPGAVYFPAWSMDDTRIYAPTQKPDTLQVLDSATGALRGGRAFADGECIRPHEVRLSPDGRSLLVVCEGDHKTPGAIVALDRDTLALQQSLPVGLYPDRLTLAEAP
jgi:DNA-binding beta-propeller fold protein YncE